MGLLDFFQGASNAAAGNVSGPVDAIAWALRKAGVPVGDAPMGSSQWMAQMGLTRPANGYAGLLGEAAGLSMPIVAAAKAPKIARGLLDIGSGGKIADADLRYLASRSQNIYDPKPTVQRQFHDDYPQGVGGQDGSRLAVDIDGRPLTAQYVAGRRVVGDVDEGIQRIDSHRIADALGIPQHSVQRSGSDLKGDVGRYISGPDRRIYVDQSLQSDQAARVLEHELGHGIDDLAFGGIGPGGSKIPTDGIKKELLRVYEDLNTPGWFKPGRGMTPNGQGYAANRTDAELMAEAVRAYMRDPNYLKTIAPNTARRIREYVNANPNINKTIQFNSLAPAAGAGLLGIWLFGSGDQGGA